MCIICDVITLLFTHFERVIHRCLYQYEFLSHSKFQKGHRVNEVGKAVGFKTYTHFIRTFTNKYGHSPTKFVKERESLQNRKIKDLSNRWMTKNRTTANMQQSCFYTLTFYLSS